MGFGEVWEMVKAIGKKWARRGRRVWEEQHVHEEKNWNDRREGKGRIKTGRRLYRRGERGGEAEANGDRNGEMRNKEG
jgi:hypothetical protein